MRCMLIATAKARSTGTIELEVDMILRTETFGVLISMAVEGWQRREDGENRTGGKTEDKGRS